SRRAGGGRKYHRDCREEQSARAERQSTSPRAVLHLMGTHAHAAADTYGRVRPTCESSVDVVAFVSGRESSAQVLSYSLQRAARATSRRRPACTHTPVRRTIRMSS